MGIRKIKYMSDFSSLFLATYINQRQTDTEKYVYFSKNFKDIVEYICNDLVRKGVIDNENLLFEGTFDMEEFTYRFITSPIRTYWNEVLYFDVKKDCVVFEAEKQRAQKFLENYTDESKTFMKGILSYYFEIEDKVDFEKKLDIKNLILNMKSED